MTLKKKGISEMRVNLYKLMQNEKQELMLVKEKGFLYKTESDVVNSPYKIAEMMNALFKLNMQAEEYVYMLALDQKNKVNGVFEVSHGSMNQSIIDVRDFYRKALFCNATHIACCHNHPSGDSSPSQEDIDVTNRLAEAGRIMGMELIDHVIVGKENIFSFLEHDMLKKA